MITRRVRLLMGMGLTGAMMALVTACPKDAADITEVKGTGLRYPVASLGDIAFPGGELAIDRLTLADVDLTVTDAFARTQSFGTDAISFVTGCPTSSGDCPGWEFPMYNGSQDTRLPDLGDDDAAADVGITYDSIFGVPLFLGVFGGLDAATAYTVTLERVALTVNSGHDVPNVLMNDPSFGTFQRTPDAPDQLSLLGGSPGATLGSNYYQIGSFTTDAAGETGLVILSFDGTGDNDMIETNQVEGFDLPLYNYVVVYRGDPSLNDPVMRAQVGVDLDGSGAAVNNALAPFPQTAITADSMISLPGGAGRPDSVTVEFTHLQKLQQNGVYQAWLINRAESPPTVVPAVGNYQRVAILREFDPITGELLSETDSVAQSQSGISSFPGQLAVDIPDRTPTRTEIKHRLVLSDVTLSGTAPGVGFFTDVVLTIEPNGEAGSPSALAPVFFEYTDQNGTPNNFFDDASAGGLNFFGHFDRNDPTASRIVTSTEYGQATATGYVLTEGVQPTAVSVDIKNLPLPPRGYYYEGWLMNTGDGSTVSMGPITAELPDTATSLFDVDVDTDLPGVTPTGIRFANSYLAVKPGELVKKQGQNYTVLLPTFFLTLQPKVGIAEKADTDIQTGVLPVEDIVNRLKSQ